VNRYILWIAPLVLVIALVCYYQFAPSQVKKHRAQELLAKFSTTVDTQNRQQILSMLDSMLAGDAQVVLKIGFPAKPGDKTKNVTMETFTKTDFLHFIDNTLTTITDYHFTTTVRELSPGLAGTETVDFHALAQATGMQSDGNIHFSSDMICEAAMRFDSDKQKPPQIAGIICVMRLHFPPQPGKPAPVAAAPAPALPPSAMPQTTVVPPAMTPAESPAAPATVAPATAPTTAPVAPVLPTLPERPPQQP